ncbi:MAG: DUF1844 domain-containing protein [Pyrinomonadaceae bacterium]
MVWGSLRTRGDPHIESGTSRNAVLLAQHEDATIGLNTNLKASEYDGRGLFVAESDIGRDTGEEQANFKVTDRRLFNSDGTPRDVPEAERPEGKSTIAPIWDNPVDVRSSPESVSGSNAGGAHATGSGPQGAAAVQQSQANQESIQSEVPEAEESSSVELPGADDPASFASFMMSIASNAASSLGMMEHPVTGKREVELELGKHWIDVLGMLQQKTRGNLLPQEKQILESLLADLRMQYVSLTNTAPLKASRTYTGRDITGG